jgi:hypothetical protein
VLQRDLRSFASVRTDHASDIAEYFLINVSVQLSTGRQARRPSVGAPIGGTEAPFALFPSGRRGSHSEPSVPRPKGDFSVDLGDGGAIPFRDAIAPFAVNGLSTAAG